ncbi:hypothetical protein UlMin_007967 [Ulmus minor]
MAIPGEAGLEALQRLKATEPPQWLAPNETLSQTARAASQHLFSSLRPFTPKSPFDQLLIDGFDAEQIWQQIDLQSQPLLSSVRRELKRFEKNPEEIRKLKVVSEGEEKVLEEKDENLEEESDDFGEDLEAFDKESDDDEDEDEDDEEEDGEDDGEDGQEEGKGGDGDGGIEDKFLKIKDLEEFLEDDEAREYGLETKDKKKDKKKDRKKKFDEEDEEDDDEEEEEDDDDEDEDLDEEDDEDEDDPRYEDFFGSKKNKPSKQKSKSSGVLEESGSEGEDEDEGRTTLSTHEKELLGLKSKIEQMEKANLEPKTWTMQGEVTATKRPKNSALEVDLDFEHNVRPPPVITEEVTASLEDLIKSRILEGRFDDVQKAPALPSKAPRQFKELDENKSKKGLAEIYEEEYVQKTNVASAPMSSADEEKREASTLFKKLCLKLDALSHFHFTPKPVIEDMSIQANVPALAMEEIAPLAVSDAAMLAPEEVFAGKGDFKEETELTQEERKRRRANKKRKFKAEAAKRNVKKPQDSTLLNNDVMKARKKFSDAAYSNLTYGCRDC